MSRLDDPVVDPHVPELSAGGVGDLCRLIDGLDLLDRLLQIPDSDGFDGIVLGRFRLRRRLGNGRFGVVFLADDPVLHRQVVVKVPQPFVLADPDLRVAIRQRGRRRGSARPPGNRPGL